MKQWTSLTRKRSQAVSKPDQGRVSRVSVGLNVVDAEQLGNSKNAKILCRRGNRTYALSPLKQQLHPCATNPLAAEPFSDIHQNQHISLTAREYGIWTALVPKARGLSENGTRSAIHFLLQIYIYIYV